MWWGDGMDWRFVLGSLGEHSYRHIRWDVGRVAGRALWFALWFLGWGWWLSAINYRIFIGSGIILRIWWRFSIGLDVFGWAGYSIDGFRTAVGIIWRLCRVWGACIGRFSALITVWGGYGSAGRLIRQWRRASGRWFRRVGLITTVLVLLTISLFISANIR